MEQPDLSRKYGWIPDLPDHRDHKYGMVRPLFATARPTSVDLRPEMPPVYDQGQLGSCTANAIAAALQFERHRQGLPDFMPSRLFVYYNERAMEGTIQSDAGAQIRDGIKSVAAQGDCPETEWAYVPAEFTVQPPQSCYDDAVKYKVTQYLSVDQDVDAMRDCLASGFPFVFGFTVYSSFESAEVAQTGHAPMPGWLDRVLGGHAVLAVGYDDATSCFLVRNSWGSAWGQGGYFTLPYSYLANQDLTSDLWTIRLVQ
jgi:C1A family cysteine protease